MKHKITRTRTTHRPAVSHLLAGAMAKSRRRPSPLLDATLAAAEEVWVRLVAHERHPFLPGALDLVERMTRGEAERRPDVTVAKDVSTSDLSAYGVCACGLTDGCSKRFRIVQKKRGK